MELPGKSIFIGGAILALGIGGGMAVASIPSANGTISGCVLKPGGTVRIIDTEAGATCKKGEVPLNWNQQGVPGADYTDFATYEGDDLYQERTSPLMWISETYCDPGDPVVGIEEQLINTSESNVEVYRVDGTGDFAGQEGYRTIVRSEDSGYTIPFCLDENGDHS